MGVPTLVPRVPEGTYIGWVSETQILRAKVSLDITYTRSPVGWHVVAEWAGCPHGLEGSGENEHEAFRSLCRETCGDWDMAEEMPEAERAWLLERFETVTPGRLVYVLMSGGYPEEDHPIAVFTEREWAKAIKGTGGGEYVLPLFIVDSEEELARWIDLRRLPHG